MIRFKTPHHADVVMHDAIAEKLIKQMGASGAIPSALDPDMIVEAMEKLNQVLSQPSAQSTPQEQAVSLSHRAAPLMALLKSALDTNETVMWQKTNSV
ncbi:DUF1840 family protein [Thiomicrospira microaerophila]|uniref:DUF1840 family protein n=1 Tax=Thiomicrospira microaerophila TaxID=406020 RepID=UPI0005CB2113|nr:DUF1840 family protein [Thiomicrospira microaerophila]